MDQAKAFNHLFMVPFHMSLHPLRPQVREAVAAGTLTEADLDVALTNTLRMRFLTGQFDPPSTNPWASLPVSTVNNREHRKLARQVVHKGMLAAFKQFTVITDTLSAVVAEHI
jgi:beta-glucosidase-like glycosyl hydrolase